jgi:hypothetical protein
MFEDRLLMRIFRTKIQVIVEGRRKLLYEELHNMYILSDIVGAGVFQSGFVS